LARDGDPEDVHFEETDTSLAIGWKGAYRIEGAAFVYAERDSGRVVTVLGTLSSESQHGVIGEFQICLASIQKNTHSRRQNNTRSAGSSSGVESAESDDAH
jgi:hypothetical protein